MRCTICGHDGRAEMEHAAVGGIPVKQVARHHQVSYAALRRHLSAHLPRAVVDAAEDSKDALADDLLAQARFLRDQASEILVGARERGDDRVALQAVREGARCLELEARLTGELVERRAVEVSTVSLHQAAWALTTEERRALDRMKRRLLLSGAPGYVDLEDDAWEEIETPRELALDGVLEDPLAAK